jgi:sulfatase-like protein
MSRTGDWFSHPFLFGAFFVLALISSNLGQLTAALTMRPLLFSLVLPGVLLLVFWLFVRDWRKAALAATGIVILFFTYGRVYAATETAALSGIRLGGHRIQALVWLALAAGWIYLSIRRLDPEVWTRSLNIFGLVLVAVPMVQILYFGASRQLRNQASAAAMSGHAPIQLQVPVSAASPDIYYIVLDMYTRADALKRIMHYDNEPFLNTLRNKGFYVADCSLSNYVYTTKSLTSSLNMAHLDELSPEFASRNHDETALYPYLKNNRVRDALGSAGYKFVAFEDAYSPLNFSDADVFYPYSEDPARALTIGGLNPFESVLLQTTAGTILFDIAPSLPAIKPVIDGPYTQYRGRILYAMDKIHEAVHLPGPKFVFLHMMAPHNPFVFGPDGEQVQRRTPFTQNGDTEYLDEEEYIQGYTDELTYLNKRMDEITTFILENSDNPPVIIIQGDHGVARPGGGRYEAWHNANLSAYFLPGGRASDLYPAITPVNSFRVIFDQYFNAGLPLEEDTACYTPGDSFACQVVKDPNPVCAAIKQP